MVGSKGWALLPTYPTMNGIFFEGTPEQNFLGHIMSEVYKEQVYAPFLVDKKDLTILDIGANVGITALYFSRFASKVYSLEPSTEHFNCLKHMLEFNKIENVVPIQKALYIKNGKFPFGGPTINKTMRSLHMATWQDKKPDEEVETITLDTLFEENKIEHVDLMKLDVEGSEIEIISSEGFRKVADKIDKIIMENHSWNGRNPSQVKGVLDMRGFDVVTLPTDASILVATKR
jgi:FkbM family methyltransferase